jgi:hypothetical protein
VRNLDGATPAVSDAGGDLRAAPTRADGRFSRDRRTPARGWPSPWPAAIGACCAYEIGAALVNDRLEAEVLPSLARAMDHVDARDLAVVVLRPRPGLRLVAWLVVGFAVGSLGRRRRRRCTPAGAGGRPVR